MSVVTSAGSTTLSDYADIVGPQVVDELRFLGEKLQGTRVLHVNSTAEGGGVAEILHRFIPLMEELGIPSTWEVVEGNAPFFNCTKTIHNALHDMPGELTEEDKQAFLATNAENIKRMPLDQDVIIIHDPQPAAFIYDKAKTDAKWIWRCHVDVSGPNPRVWQFLRQFVDLYDGAIFSASKFSQVLPIRQFLISPSIDPLSPKNEELSDGTIKEIMHKLEIPRDKPIITQVSRFDRIKDPVGVIEAYKLVKKTTDCRLVLVGGGATDDPEGAQVVAEVRERAAADPDIIVMELPPDAHREINAIQRASSVLIQKSLREGFALTVTEALWKGKPIVASDVGGIPLQIAHRYSGMLCRSITGAARRIKQCLNNPEFSKQLGINGKEHIRRNFLLTRHLKDYMLLMAAIKNEGKVISL